MRSSRKVLILPIAILAFLILLLVPMIPVTFTTPGCHSVFCLGIPYATELPNGQYSFVMHKSVIYSLFHVGGYIVAGLPLYLVMFPFVTTVSGGILFWVVPLCAVDLALFFLAFLVGKQEQEEKTVARLSEIKSV